MFVVWFGQTSLYSKNLIIGPFSLPSKGQAAPHLSFLLWKDVIAFLLLLLPHMPSLVRFKR